MKKSVKFLTMVMALVLVCAAFAPAALAATPYYNWGNFPLQSESSYNSSQTKGIQRYLNISLNTLLDESGLGIGTELKIDGNYGWRTYEAVKLFQGRVSGLKVDGIVGSATWAEMYKHLMPYVTDNYGRRYYGVLAVYNGYWSNLMNFAFYNNWWYYNLNDSGNPSLYAMGRLSQ